MMYKVFAFVALLCVVNAYVGVRVYDENVDVDISRASEVRSCNQRDCDQTCRRIGFPGGACVDDRCKCDILLDENEIPAAAADAAAAIGNSAVEAAAQEFSSFALPFQSMGRACTSSLCVSVCRALGCSSGYCISSTTCQCYGC